MLNHFLTTTLNRSGTGRSARSLRQLARWELSSFVEIAHIPYLVLDTSSSSRCPKHLSFRSRGSSGCSQAPRRGTAELASHPNHCSTFSFSFDCPTNWSFNSTVNLFPVGQLIDWSDQSVDQISSSIWPVGDPELLKDLITGWSPGLVLNQSINQISINLLFKSFSFAALPTPTTPTVRDYQKLCPALTESPRWPFDNINRSLSLFQQICSLRKGK